ncbi:nucleotidyltransferase family protein [Aestuariivita boseongensis]|uniref:nucleotidyltransferase family protein n=1 Tax=Aestuariivita boseongensis TaxID=1470562 RepID=UPI0006807345|nr:nucleotidyltransferase family protein [Aestuariivita boseongensis]
MDLPVIILAAGASSRMGGADKLLQHVDGQPLLARQARLALAVTDGPVIVALPPAPHRRHDALADLPVEICSVPDAAEGMNASLRAAVAALPPDAPGFMLLLADLPDLYEDDLRAVLGAVDYSQITLVWRGATEDGAPGHPVVFHRDLIPAFASLTGDSGGREVIAMAKGKVQLIPLPGQRARHDLDTPEAWAAWRAANPTRI